jgi:membrane protease YdiL (CAAX protease family)
MFNQESIIKEKAIFSRKEQSFEVLVFLFLIAPSVAFSFFAVKQGTISFIITGIATILRDLSLVALVLFFIWRNKESIKSIGWAAGKGWKEVLLGILLFPPLFFVTGFLERLLVDAGFSSSSTPLPELEATGGLLQTVLGLILVIVVAVSEETIFRGYLILRFKNIFSSPSAAVVLSFIIFSLGHGYEGTAGVATVGFIGFIFAVVYLWRGSLIAPMVMHFMQDFLGIVLLPLLTTK